jgi:putative ATP-binding cassette transporter
MISGLSGGELQRLSLARALIQKPQWLFLDEATSSLDKQAEAQLLQLLRTRLPETAIIIIAHSAMETSIKPRIIDLNILSVPASAAA